ncbi:TonB-dependent receptor [Daejeonella lutea]|uniref:Outer membrane receptor proteins, mostly Fe transport n=1 Tax=Daejeonella lutea TaxID=572036 RepID=A0A1T4ZYM1_9SPHI|nr:TonB-dependent receptor [Daejeonella lutea]SKB27832.1 Outer membrane receptor proteins, mostly Fe transport [Daejeonella lutea]
MKHNVFPPKLSFLLLFILISQLVYSQQPGKITGKVTDSSNGETLIGLTIKLGTTGGVSTDVEGRYNFGNLQPGMYQLTFTYIGYKAKSITDVEVKAGQVTMLDVAMQEDTGMALDEVVITVTARQESIGALYAQQKNSVSISSGIAADQIKRSPDKNTSEVLKRVSGASVQDNKFIIVRGLADRYNVALINNAILPSSEPDRRAFSFDIIPSNLIDKVIINKTARPDLPGDFAGGVTQIVTKDVPDQNFLSFAITGGYNTQSTFKNFVSNGRNSTDFLGFDDGTRQMPSGFPSTRQRYNAASTDRKIGFTKLLPNSFGERTSTALPVQSYQLNWGNLKDFEKGGSFGSIISVTYRNSQNYLDANREAYDGANFAYQFQDENYRYSTNLGGVANFTYKKGSNKLSLKNLFNQSFEDSYISRTGYNQNQNSDIEFSSSELSQKSLFNSQLEGEHLLGKIKLKLDWNLNYALLLRDQPDLRSVMYLRQFNATGPFEMVDDYSRRFFSQLTENNYGGNFALTLPIGRNNSLKAGGMKQFRQRDFSARNFLYEPASVQFDDSKLTLPKDVIFSEPNISTTGFAFNEITNNNDKYFGESDLNAGFLMLDNNIGRNLRVVWGTRVESYYQYLDARDLANKKVKAEETYLDILPSANFTYALNPKTNLRLSGSRTVSRPEFRELAPFAFFNQEESAQVTGNPDLLRSQNTNADLRWETYPSNGEVLSAAVFYKNFQNPIEQVVSSSSTPDNLKFGYANASTAYSYGIEFELRKKLSFLSASSPWLENMIAFANFTYIKSEVDINQAGQEKRALQGQSPYLINAGLQYKAVKSGIMLSTLYNKVGARISKVGNPLAGVENFYENGRDVVDFQIAKRIMKDRAEIKLNISDILNQKQVFYQNYDGNKVYNSGKDIEFYGYRIGTNLSLGFSYDLKLHSK